MSMVSVGIIRLALLRRFSNDDANAARTPDRDASRQIGLDRYPVLAIRTTHRQPRLAATPRQ